MAPKPGNIIPILTKKIHPPLPMTPRESQRLSNSLLQAFHNVLEREHGADKSTTAHTDVHMASILNSPHFSGSRHMNETTRLKGRDRTRRSSAAVQGVKELQANLTQPVHMFARQVAEGEATLESAKECMKAYDLLHELAGDQLQPGAVIINWLYSSGLEESLEFIYDRQFINNLIRHLFKEQKYARISAWHARIARIPVGPYEGQKELLQASTSLMFWHIHHADKALGLKGALSLFDHELMKQIQSTKTTIIGGHSMGKELLRFRTAGNYLFSRLAPEPLREPHSNAKDSSFMDHHVFDKFNSGIRHWCSVAQGRYKEAILALHHPEHPSDTAALAQIASFRPAEVGTKAFTEHITLCLDTAKWYFERKRADDAVRLLNKVHGFLNEHDTRGLSPVGDFSSLISKLNPWDEVSQGPYSQIRPVGAQGG